jgi:hypothetical protein
MIEFLLAELEKSPKPVFSKNELIGISENQFQDLYKKKILEFHRPKNTGPEKIQHPRCPHGCYLTVIEHEEELEAFCDDHPEEGTIAVSENDLLRYTFSVENLLKLIAQTNELSGSLQEIDGGFLHFGHKKMKGKQVGFVFIHNLKAIRQTELIGLRNICKSDELVIVFTPISFVEDLQLKSILSAKNIGLTSLSESIDLHSLKLVDEAVLLKTTEVIKTISELDFQLIPKKHDVWFKEKFYDLTEQQFKVVEYLYECYEAGEPLQRNKDVIKYSLHRDYFGTDLHSIFRSRPEAWNELFIRPRGKIRLNLPDPS